MGNNSNETMLALLEPGVEYIPNDDDDDYRPATSPYGDTLCQLYFKGQGPLYVPNGLLHISPVLADGLGENNILEIGDLALDAGHVMIHFLYRGKYQCLKPKGQTAQNKRTAEFATSLRVYSAARVYRLPRLRVLATRQIKRLGDGLSLPCILDVLHDVHPNLCDEDEWLETYLTSRTRSELDRLDKPRAETLLIETGCATTINKALLRAVVSRELERTEALAEELKQARRELDAHYESIGQRTRPDSVKKPPSVDYVELESAVEYLPEDKEPPTEELPEEEKPHVVVWPAEEDIPAAKEDIPAEEDIPAAKEDISAEEYIPATEEGYHEVAEEDFYPPADVPLVEDDPSSGHRIDYHPYDSNFDEPSQLRQLEDSNPGHDHALAEQGDEWQHESLVQVPPTIPEPLTSLSIDKKFDEEPKTLSKKSKKKTKKEMKKDKKSKKANSVPEPPPPAEVEEKVEEANRAEGPIVEVDRGQGVPVEASDENWPWSVVSSSTERTHLANHLKSSDWRGCSECSEYLNRLTQDLQDDKK